MSPRLKLFNRTRLFAQGHSYAVLVRLSQRLSLAIHLAGELRYSLPSSVFLAFFPSTFSRKWKDTLLTTFFTSSTEKKYLLFSLLHIPFLFLSTITININDVRLWSYCLPSPLFGLLSLSVFSTLANSL